jgi:hypothetical protein
MKEGKRRQVTHRRQVVKQQRNKKKKYKKKKKTGGERKVTSVISSSSPGEKVRARMQFPRQAFFLSRLGLFFLLYDTHVIPPLI